MNRTQPQSKSTVTRKQTQSKSTVTRRQGLFSGFVFCSQGLRKVFCEFVQSFVYVFLYNRKYIQLQIYNI